MDWEVRAAAFFLCLSIFLGTIQNGTTERKIVCYYTNWSVYRPGTAKFSPQNINPYLCTHLIYAFGGFTKDNALKPFDKYQDIEKGGYAKFTGLKTYNKDLKTMLAIGGWNEGSSRFSPMVADPARRKEFVKNSIKFLRQNHFDGLDLDWEYPASRDGGKPRDKDNYASLVQELREEFERETTKTGRTRLLLSMAVPAGIEYLDKGYDVPRLNEYLDFINLLSYDYHSVFDTAVNHHAPLYSLEEDNEYNFNSKLTIDYTINHLVQSGASPEKIVLGIPTYGRSFTLLNEDATDLGSPADGPGSKGDTTRQEGYLAYYEICEGIAESDDWEVVQPNPTAMGPYAFKDDQWVGYDDEAIVKLKARYVNEKNLGGIMFWSIDNDDFRGKCHNRPYPLIEAAKEALLTGETENSVQKTKITSGRKKNRNHGNQNNAVSRKLGSSSRRSTTVAPPPRKRISSSRPRYRTISRPKFIAEESEEDQIVERRSYDASSSFSSSQEDVVENGNTVKASEETEATRPRKRNKTRSRQSSGKRRKSSQREKEEANSSSEESLSNKLTTPEPPTTPDPGGDFKCEDEGFFSHPRDCKKYFWCLDSGPGGLGVVAHQFTCPSGLVFNKAADSCDYPRNVVCPKSKTTKTAASTTRAPITAATSRTTYLHSTTQRTTTTTSESKEEYEYYEDDYELDEEEEEQEEEEVRAKPKITSTSKPLQYKTINRSKPTSTTTSTTTTTSRPLNNDFDKIIDEEDEEDPKVIKELINLIRKAGGIEQLEKQLQIQGKSSDTTSNNDPITPATISRSLYERVLNRQASKISNSDRSTSFSTTNYQNGPGRTQFEGLDEVPEVKNLRRTQKPQYVTIERPKITTDAPEAEEEDDDNEDIYNDNKDTSSEEQAVSNLSEISSSTHRITPNYVSIRRNRLSTTTSRDENVVSENNEDNNSKRPTRRRRPVSFKRSGNEESAEDSLELEESREKLSASTQQSGIENITPTTKSRYINIQRFRSTTLKPTESYNKETDNLPVFESNNESSTTKVNADKDDEITENPNKITSTVSSTTLSTFSSSTTSSTSTTQIVDVNNQADSIKNTSIVDSIIDTTTDTSVKLVEDSATEILLTTAPAKLNQPVSTTNVVATVSQPRPFGFTRRKPTVALSDVTTPLAPSLDQPKVSITTRNFTRSNSFAVGRGRLKSRSELSNSSVSTIEQTITREQIESPRTADEETSNRWRDVIKSRLSTTRRGSNRYTPPTTNLPIERNFGNTISRKQNHATESSTTSKIVVGNLRRKYRRPSKQTNNENSTISHFEDSPIIRITPKRTKNFKSTNGNSIDKETYENITNIKVFQRPATVDVGLYGRTKFTKNINDIVSTETDTKNDKISVGYKKSQETSPYAYVTETALKFTEVNEQITKINSSKTTDFIKANEQNSITNDLKESLLRVTTETDENSTISVSEKNGFESTEIPDTTVSGIEISTDNTILYEASENPEKPFVITNPTVSAVDIDADLVKTTLDANNIDVLNPTEKYLIGQRRRKVLFRKRLLAPSNITTSMILPEEKNPKGKTLSRRKVIKRIRPINDKPSLPSSETPNQDDGEDLVDYNVSLKPIMLNISSNDNESSTYFLNNDSEKYTDLTTEYSTVWNVDSTLIDENDYDFENNTDEKITFDEVISETSTTPMTKQTYSNDNDYFITTERTLEPSTTVTESIVDYEKTDIFDEKSLTTILEKSLETTSNPIISTLSDSQPDIFSIYNKSNTSESRYIRKKFIRRRPVLSTKATNNHNQTLSKIQSYASSTTEATNSKVLAKRRKSLFVRRRPIPLATTKTIENFEDILDVHGRINNERKSDDFIHLNSTEDTFLKYYTTPVVRSMNPDEETYPSTETFEKILSEKEQEDEYTDVNPTERERKSFDDRGAGLQFTHKTSNSLKNLNPSKYQKVPNIDEILALRRWYPLDSSPEETEETPKTNEANLRFTGYRQPRMGYKNQGKRLRGTTNEETETTRSSYESSTQNLRTRFYSKQPTTSTETTFTETLIPAKKFDYVADAFHRRQQSLRSTTQHSKEIAKEITTTPLYQTVENQELQNFVDADYTTVSSLKPLITRLVTSVAESGTTERQKILIKTKYSSSTSTTRIPAQSMINRIQYPVTTPSSVSKEKIVDPSREANVEESANEIRDKIETSTLPIESEFTYRGAGRFTTESYGSSTIEIESVDSLATQRLPTLKELIGYQTDVYTTTQSSTYLNLYSIDTNGDNDFKNMEESLERNKSNFETNREYKKNEYITVLDNPNQNSRNYESWILQGLKDNINITTSEKKADGFDTILEDHFIDTNAIYDESLTNKKRKTRIDHTDSTITTLKPTTMRGTLIRTSSEKAATRGFYVTKNDSESSLMKVTVPIYLTSTNITPTESVLEREDSTTTVPLTTDPYSFSTTDEILYNAEESVSMATINDYQQNYDSVSSTTKNLKSQYDIKKSILFTESIEEPNTYNDATTLSWTERLTNSTNDRTTISLLSDSTKLTEDNFEISVNNATDMCVNSKFSMECSNINTNKNKKITEEPNIPKITVDEVMPTTVSKFTVTMKNLSDNFLQDPTITKTYWTTTDLSDHIEEVTDFEESKISNDNTFINNFSTENNINLTTDSKSLHMPEVITDTSIDNIEHTSMPPIMYTTQDDIENTTLDTVISTKEKETFQSTIKTTMENYMNDGIETSTEKDKNIENKEIMDDTTPNSFNFMTTMTKYDIKSNSNENSATISLNVDNSYFKPTISPTLETNAVQHFNPISENINAYITSEITTQESEAITQELTLKSKEIVSESNESQTTTITLKNESMGVKKYFTKDDSSTSIDFISTPQNSINDSNFKEIVSEKGYQDVKLVTLSTKVTEIPAGIDQTLLSTLSTINNDKFTANVGRRRQKIRVNKSNYEFGRRRIPQTTEKILLETDRSYPKRRVKIFRGRQRKTNSSSSTTLKSTAVSEDNFDREKTSQKPRRIKVILKKTKIKIEEIKKEDELDGGITTNDRNFRQDIRPVAEYTERPLDEVTFSKNIGTSIRPSGNIPINRQRKPHTQTVPSTSNKLPSTVAVYRKTRLGEVTLPPTTVKIDSREETTVIPQQPVKDEDQKSEMSDQNTRAQELAVTLADPPSSQSSSSTGRQPLRNALRRKISTTVTPRTSPSQINSTTLKFSAVSRNRQRPTTKGRPIDNTSTKPRQRPVIDYDYYEDEEEPVVGKSTFNGKLFLTSKGTIRCLDQGNFPHPYSCKKFITCARMVNGQVIGAEYTCPDKLSFDPVGGICNWSAGLGCKE